MPKMLYKSDGTLSGKPRIYFTCHPEDFSSCFDRIYNDILTTHPAVFFYKDDMSASVPEADRGTDIASNNLLVVPVTLRLLNEKNVAMDEEIPYAFSVGMTVLPLMMEPGLDPLYGRPDRFGRLQYLSACSTDGTEIRYEEKLKNYLESVLTSGEMAARIRKAFDARIFLSYRKDDRRQANELMRRIHGIPKFRDLAIWYDEFLTPGEDFSADIEENLKQSQLFAMAVTPLLASRRPDGTQNYVMSTEYPAAVGEKLPILPLEVESTDGALLSGEFPGIPPCIDGTDAGALEAALAHLTDGKNDNDPEHLYLIGRAYLDGIDVEIDRPRGVELLSAAGEQGYIPAMTELSQMYRDGTGVALDYGKALYWTEKLRDTRAKTLGPEAPETMTAMNDAVQLLLSGGRYAEALELGQEVLALRTRVLGEEDPDTLMSRNDVSYAWGMLGKHDISRDLQEEVYALRRKVLGEDHSDTLRSLNNLACENGESGRYARALELHRESYERNLRLHGERSQDTLFALNNLARAYGDVGDFRKSLELNRESYEAHTRYFGPDRPETVMTLNNLARAYDDAGDEKRAMELYREAYERFLTILGESHPYSLLALNNYAITLKDNGNKAEGLRLGQKAYDLHCKFFGPEHETTLHAQHNLSSLYGFCGRPDLQLELILQVYEIRCRTMGKTHPDTLASMNGVAHAYNCVGEREKSLNLFWETLEVYRQVLGEDHPETMSVLENISAMYYNRKDLRKSLELLEEVAARRRRILGKEHPKTRESLRSIREIRKELGWR